MRTRETKAEFSARMKHENNNRKQLRKVYNDIFLPMLEKYDGKVYNARFTNELSNKLQEVNGMMSCRQESQSGVDITLYLEIRNSLQNYRDTERLYIKIICDYAGGNCRVNAEKSKGEKYAVAWLENFDKETAIRTEAAKNYDKYLKLACKMEEIVKEYNALPHCFREIVDTQYLSIY